MPDVMTMFLDKDYLFKLGLTAAALAISAFILWGPRLGSRRSNKGGLPGLQNLGLTCFVNSLLQALASCPFFVGWLHELKGNGGVTDALTSILELLAYERSSGDWGDETGSPGQLLSALSRHGWRIAPQEQDTHELFVLLLTTLEEEHAKSLSRPKGSLLDALDSDTERDGGVKSSHQVTSHGDIPRVTMKSKQRISLTKALPSPFRGYMKSQLKCLSCGSWTPTSFEKFDSLSLHLPAGRGDVRLTDLLEGVVRGEVIDGFSCDKGCPESSKALKTSLIVKLPACLCLHISRTQITSDGQVYKKENYVDFPEFLSMAKFIAGGQRRAAEAMTGVTMAESERAGGGGGEHPPGNPPSQAAVDGLVGVGEGRGEGGGGPEEEEEGNNNVLAQRSEPASKVQPLNNGALFTKSVEEIFTVNGHVRSNSHLYRLKAVVEHKGTVESGHFVTYRRGPLNSDVRHRSFIPSRWYYTSDSDVRNSTMCDALLANAYLIFYEKCSSV